MLINPLNWLFSQQTVCSLVWQEDFKIEPKTVRKPSEQAPSLQQFTEPVLHCELAEMGLATAKRGRARTAMALKNIFFENEMDW